MLACSVGPSGLETPFALEGDGVHIVVRSTGGCGGSAVRVGLWGEGFGTRGEVHADVVPDDDGSTWLHFSVSTGLGGAVAALRVEGESGLLPLGTRPGEYGLQLRRTPIDEDKLKGAAIASAHSLNLAIQSWEDGAFLLKQAGQTVGEIRFRGDLPPMVSLFDAWWLTPRPVEAAVSADGAEILLAFDVQPSLKGEGGLLRVNAPLKKVVAPIGAVPIPEERRFDLVAGRLAEGEFESATEAAKRSADTLEIAAIEYNAQRLAGVAARKGGGCLPWSELVTQWGVLFEGYTVRLIDSDEGCSIGIEATRSQHGRRFRGVVTP